MTKSLCFKTQAFLIIGPAIVVIIVISIFKTLHYLINDDAANNPRMVKKY